MRWLCLPCDFVIERFYACALAAQIANFHGNRITEMSPVLNCRGLLVMVSGRLRDQGVAVASK
jgi:hypothetical protein